MVTFIVTMASYITADQILPYLPVELKVFAPTIIGIIALIGNQWSEEERVLRAEAIKEEQLLAPAVSVSEDEKVDI